MSYTPTTWTTGDTITASAMNKIENGIANAGGALIVSINRNTDTLDKTFLEIYTALRDGVPAYVKNVFEADGPSADYESVTMMQPILEARKYDNIYAVYVNSTREGQVSGNYYVGSPCVTTFRATSVNDYPVFYGNTVATNVSFYD